jgi:hypothetical protein
VDPALIAEKTAVSSQVGLAMAQGALIESGADYAVAVTGLAGPFFDENGECYPLPPEHEPGLVYIACACRYGAAVVRRIRRVLAENNIPFDKKRFSPHITLIRKASGDMPGLAQEPVSMTVDTISLMRSDRGRNGMIYTELGTVEGETA